ncbi:MAG: GNAT family N-acetyltransferase [bacterium]
MYWKNICDDNYERAAQLLRQIDVFQRYILDNDVELDNFGGWLCRYYYSYKDILGVITACIYNEKILINISFDPDMPDSTGDDIIKILKKLINNTDKAVRIWCRYQNKNLISLISKKFLISPTYRAREMSISKSNFSKWKEPIIPQGYHTRGYSKINHSEYINLLEEAMGHLHQEGEHPYIKRSESLANLWSDTSVRNSFISLWENKNLIAFCHGVGGEVTQLAVGKSYQRKGYGYLLLHNTIKYLYQVSDSLICLYVVDENINAYKFYSGIGMKETGHCARFTLEPGLLK